MKNNLFGDIKCEAESLDDLVNSWCNLILKRLFKEKETYYEARKELMRNRPVGNDDLQYVIFKRLLRMLDQITYEQDIKKDSQS